MAGGEVIAIRPMTVDDVPAAAAIERATYPQPWSEGVFREELAAPGRTYLAASSDGRLLGYGGLLVVGSEAHITTVVVDAGHRGGGIGTRLMLALVEAARRQGATSLTLEVRISNAAAQLLYRRFGMAPVGVRKRYYGDEDALIMWVHDIDSDEYGERLEEIRSSLEEAKP